MMGTPPPADEPLLTRLVTAGLADVSRLPAGLPPDWDVSHSTKQTPNSRLHALRCRRHPDKGSDELKRQRDTMSMAMNWGGLPTVKVGGLY